MVINKPKEVRIKEFLFRKFGIQKLKEPFGEYTHFMNNKYMANKDIEVCFVKIIDEFDIEKSSGIDIDFSELQYTFSAYTDHMRTAEDGSSKRKYFAYLIIGWDLMYKYDAFGLTFNILRELYYHKIEPRERDENVTSKDVRLVDIKCIDGYVSQAALDTNANGYYIIKDSEDILNADIWALDRMMDDSSISYDKYIVAKAINFLKDQVKFKNMSRIIFGNYPKIVRNMEYICNDLSWDNYELREWKRGIRTRIENIKDTYDVLIECYDKISEKLSNNK